VSAVKEWLTLPYDTRQRSRFRSVLDGGREVAVVLERGNVLRQGDVLAAADGTLVGVRAADELLSVATAPDTLTALRAAYHLGNRHVPLHIADQRLAYLHDHVLDDMVQRLGLSIVQMHAPFEPEAGAYHGDSHSQPHSHSSSPPSGVHSHAGGDGGGGGHAHSKPIEAERDSERDIPTRVELAKPRRAPC
jgi:urease accessory protein